MPPPAPRFEIQHPCLRHPRRSSPLGAAGLSDRERIGVLLEGCALDAHLVRIGLRPAGGWEAARVSTDGRLVAVAIERGAADSTTAATALDRATLLLRRLFPGDDSTGRGDGRRVARELARRWALYLTPVGPDDLVADVLEIAAFLWRERFAAYRESLAASIGGDGVERLSIAGPARFRRRVIERASTRAGGCRCCGAPRRTRSGAASRRRGSRRCASRGRCRGRGRAEVAAVRGRHRGIDATLERATARPARSIA